MEAAEFFRQLTEFSRRYFLSLKFKHSVSPWGRPAYREGLRGAIVHFTADHDLERVVCHFMDPARKASASAHVVVAEHRLTAADRFLEGLPLVQALPVTVVQCRDWQTEACHATWTNAWSYGIENLNVGELRPGPAGELCWWKPATRSAPEWTTPFPGDGKRINRRVWAPWSLAQVQANVMILRHLCGVAPIVPTLVLGHEQVQGRLTVGGGGNDKRDPGPLFPMAAVRNAVFGGDMPTGCGEWEAGDFRERCVKELTAAEGPAAWKSFLDWKLPVQSVKCALRLLGYHVAYPQSSDFTAAETESVEVFQRLMGLEVDGVAGPLTVAALRARLQDRGIVPNSG